MNDLRRKQLDWLAAVEARLNLSQTELARRAGVDPSTLSKFKRGRPTQHLDHSVIEKIAAESGISPYAKNPVESGLAEEAEPFRFDAEAKFNRLVKDYIAGRASVVPFVLKTRALETIGYMPGDIVLLDLNAPWVPGAIVCAHYWRPKSEGEAETVWRRYDPPYLLAHTHDPVLARPIELDHVDQNGVVLLNLRPAGNR